MFRHCLIVMEVMCGFSFPTPQNWESELAAFPVSYLWWFTSEQHIIRHITLLTSHLFSRSKSALHDLWTFLPLNNLFCFYSRSIDISLHSEWENTLNLWKKGSYSLLRTHMWLYHLQHCEVVCFLDASDANVSENPIKLNSPLLAGLFSILWIFCETITSSTWDSASGVDKTISVLDSTSAS